MKKGQVIRRKMNDGTPIGPYLVIDRITQNSVDCHMLILGNKIPRTISKNHVYEYNSRIVRISDHEIVDMEHWHDMSIIYKKSNKTLDKLCDNIPEMVIFRSINHEAVILDCCFNRIQRYNNGKYIPMIRISGGRVVLWK